MGWHDAGNGIHGVFEDVGRILCELELEALAVPVLRALAACGFSRLRAFVIPPSQIWRIRGSAVGEVYFVDAVGNRGLVVAVCATVLY